MKRKYLSALMIVPGLILCSASAQAGLNFDFSFTNTVGNIDGTVTGTIEGLTDNSTGAATNVVITSWPSALDGSFSLPYSAPLDVTSWGIQLTNSFTVDDGQLISGGFSADDEVFDFFTLGSGCNLNQSCGDGFGNWRLRNAVETSGDLTSAPEPSTFGYLALAVAGALVSLRRVKSTSRVFDAEV